MEILDIPESVLYEFKLVTVHLELFYLVRIGVELAQSDLLSGGHLKFPG